VQYGEFVAEHCTKHIEMYERQQMVLQRRWVVDRSLANSHQRALEKRITFLSICRGVGLARNADPGGI
jgi:hypothetical protein